MQINAGTTIEMTVPGQTRIMPGLIIDFEIRPVETDGVTADDKAYDAQYSGRYVIGGLTHKIVGTTMSTQALLLKDSIPR